MSLVGKVVSNEFTASKFSFLWESSENHSFYPKFVDKIYPSDVQFVNQICFNNVRVLSWKKSAKWREEKVKKNNFVPTVRDSSIKILNCMKTCFSTFFTKNYCIESTKIVW